MEPVKDTWNSSLIQAGCIDPDTVIASFKRIIMQGDHRNFFKLQCSDDYTDVSKIVD